MQPFIHDNFLLTNRRAEKLYHEHASALPIIDFHNHLLPKDIADDRVFGNISKLWLEGDHYKWRAMRANGVNEKFITGDGSDWEKFAHWARTVPKTLRSPLYHWTHLELARYFNVDTLLNPDTARQIYDACNAKAETSDFSVRNLLRRMNIKYLCTTEDPTSDLSWHRRINETFEIEVSAAFRPDNAFALIAGDFKKYLQALAQSAGLEITTFRALCDALEQRHNYFHDFGCRLADFAVDWFVFTDISDQAAERIVAKVLTGKEISWEEHSGFTTHLLSFLCELNHNRKWTQQFHMGALRNVNEKGTAAIGAACGFDAISDLPYVTEIGKFLNLMEGRSKLTKSVFFNLNPRDNAAVLALINSFNDGSVEGKMQYGPAWWFLDQKQGMENHLNDLSAYGVLGNFIGMLTDSRSFLSFPRHEYFRRILCNTLGEDVERGLIPDDEELLKNTIENICYHNARKYLGLELANESPVGKQITL